MTFRLATISEIDESDRTLLAELAYEAFAPYYARLSEDRALVISALAAELDEPSTELGTICAAYQGDAMVGMIAAYPSEEMEDRQKASLFCHLGCEGFDQEAILCAAVEQAGNVPALDIPHLYVARIAVTPDFRGRGVADTLIEQVASTAPASLPIGLHVHKDNARALAFYRRIGFIRTDTADLAFQALILRR